MSEVSVDEVIIKGERYVPASSISRGPDTDTDGLRYAIVRSREQGVMAGYVVRINEEAATVVLRRARQLWRWDSTFVLQDMAETGVRKPEKCQFSKPGSQESVVMGACGVMYCTETAGQSIRAVEPKCLS